MMEFINNFDWVVFFGVLIFSIMVRVFKYKPDTDWQYWVLFVGMLIVVLHDMVKYGA